MLTVKNITTRRVGNSVNHRLVDVGRQADVSQQLADGLKQARFANRFFADTPKLQQQVCIAVFEFEPAIKG